MNRTPIPPSRSLRQSSRGLTLVELMVATAVGLLVVLVIGTTYQSAATLFRSLEASSRIQENVRYAFEALSYDIRMAGVTGCANSTVANVLNNPGAWTNDLDGAPVLGYEEGSTPPSGIAGVARGDMISLLRADSSKEYIIVDHNPSSAQFQLSATHGFQKGDILVASDCGHAAVFQMTNSNNNGTISTVVHNTGNATNPGNCTKGLGSPADCSNQAGTPYTYASGGRLLRLAASAYYIKNNASGEPTLYRSSLANVGGNSGLVEQEVVDGIENMQIVYGVDTNATADGAVDTYVPASQVLSVAPGTTQTDKWRRVLAVRVSLLAVSTAAQQTNTTIQPYLYNGATVTPTDRRMRKVFTTTIGIRNRS